VQRVPAGLLVASYTHGALGWPVQLAERALLRAGFRERSTYSPLSCCLNTPVLTVPGGGGKLSDFDHKVDHIMTNTPNVVELVSSAITGRKPVNGFWNSDHAGTFSALMLR